MEPNLNSQTTVKVHTSTKDFFVYLGILVSLVITVWNIINVVFEAINKAFPDILSNNNYNYIYSYDSLRWSIALLIVIFPIYIILSYVAAGDIKRDNSKKDLGLRKLTLFVSLFVSGASIVGSLVTTIYNFLGGEISPRFLLKALFIIIISIIISSYYYYLTKRDYTQKSFVPNLFAIIAVVLVVGSVIWSVLIVGSPFEVRKQKLDLQRVASLVTISNLIVEQYKNSRELPKSLSEIKNRGYGISIVDPITNQEYEYKIIDDGKIVNDPSVNCMGVVNVVNNVACSIISIAPVFKLCANFESKSDMTQNVGTYYNEKNNQMNNHTIGRNCYIGTITNNVYKGQEYNFMSKE